MNTTAIFSLFVAATSLALFRIIYGRLKAGFFFYMLAASLFLTCSCGALCLEASLPAEAAADMSIALTGCLLMAASASLKASFRMESRHDD